MRDHTRAAQSSRGSSSRCPELPVKVRQLRLQEVKPLAPVRLSSHCVCVCVCVCGGGFPIVCVCVCVHACVCKIQLTLCVRVCVCARKTQLTLCVHVCVCVVQVSPPIQAILRHQLGVLHLTLPTWRHHQIPQARAQPCKAVSPTPTGDAGTSPGCHLCF